LDGATKWDSYMRATAAFLDCGLPNFIEEKLDLVTLPAFILEAVKNGGKSWPLKPHSDVLDAFFSSNKMRCLASFQDLYVGLEPYRNNEKVFGGVFHKTAPAVFGLLAAIELHPSNRRAGVYAPIGGFGAVAEGMRDLAEKEGVKFHYESPVVSITDKGVYVASPDGTNKNGSISFVPGDLIIVNPDVPFSSKSLISTKNQDLSSQALLAEKFDWDDSFDFSSGVIAFHWSINKTLEQLNTHNVFLIGSNRSQAEQSWRVLRGNGIYEGEDLSRTIPTQAEPFNFYVHRPVKTDPTAAPIGCETLMVLVPCQSLLRCEELSELPRKEAMLSYKKQFTANFVDNLREEVLLRLAVMEGLDDLKLHIINEVIDTPGSYAEMYNVAAGVPFGLSHGFNQLSITRPSFKHKTLENVLFVGASSRPGNGVPLVLIGAKNVADYAVKRLKVKM